MSIILSTQLREMESIAPELYEYGKRVRDRVNAIQAAPTATFPTLGLSHQLVVMGRIDSHLREFGVSLLGTVNARSSTGQKQPPLVLSRQLESMRNISSKLYEYGQQMIRFVNAL